MPDFVPVSNPLDVTAQGLVDPDMYRRILHALVADDRVGVIVLGVIQTDPITAGIKTPAMLQGLREACPLKPVIFAGLDEGAVLPDGLTDELRALGVPYFPSSERALRAVKRLRALADDAGPVEAPKAYSLPGLDTADPVIPEAAAKAILARANIPFPAGRLVASREEAP
jgi:acyl-CoA synthetase (NDP forming)